MILSSNPIKRRIRSLVSKCLIVLTVVSGSTAIAKDSESMTRFSSSSSNNTSNSASQENLANMYGLDMTQWKEYQTVLKGPRGLWSPNIHPLMALGMRKGIKDGERKKLARQYATVRYERMQRELAFEKTVLEEAMKKYGHIPLFRKNFASMQSVKPQSADSDVRVKYFARASCKQCRSQIQKWISEGRGIDIYITGNKKQITQFAKDMGISPLLVPRQISLNAMSETEMASLGIKKLPTAKYTQEAK